MSFDSSVIRIECSCGNIKNLNREQQVQIFYEEIKIVDLSKYYEKFTCQKCKKKYPKVLDKKGNLLFDPDNLAKCKTCQNFISIPRFNINTKTCSPYCEHSFIETDESKKRAQKYLKDFAENIKKQELANKKRKENLINQKNTLVNAYKKLEQKKISEEEYEKIFKEFTWEIKIQIEPLNGKLIDDPRKYIRCPKCNHFSLILWTPKYEKYFIGCSQFTNGCNWAKSVWKM